MSSLGGMDPLGYVFGKESEGDDSSDDSAEGDCEKAKEQDSGEGESGTLSKIGKKQGLNVEDLLAHGYRGGGDLKVLSLEPPETPPETRNERHARIKAQENSEIDAKRAVAHKEHTKSLMKQHWALDKMLQKIRNPEPEPPRHLKTKRTLVKVEGGNSEYFVEEVVPKVRKIQAPTNAAAPETWFNSKDEPKPGPSKWAPKKEKADKKFKERNDQFDSLGEERYQNLKQVEIALGLRKKKERGSAPDFTTDMLLNDLKKTNAGRGN